MTQLKENEIPRSTNNVDQKHDERKNQREGWPMRPTAGALLELAYQLGELLLYLVPGLVLGKASDEEAAVVQALHNAQVLPRPDGVPVQALGGIPGLVRGGILGEPEATVRSGEVHHKTKFVQFACNVHNEVTTPRPAAQATRRSRPLTELGEQREELVLIKVPGDFSDENLTAFTRRRPPPVLGRAGATLAVALDHVVARLYYQV